jgi:hypothetical protein
MGKKGSEGRIQETRDSTKTDDSRPRQAYITATICRRFASTSDLAPLSVFERIHRTDRRYLLIFRPISPGHGADSGSFSVSSGK